MREAASDPVQDYYMLDGIGSESSKGLETLLNATREGNSRLTAFQTPLFGLLPAAYPSAGAFEGEGVQSIRGRIFDIFVARSPPLGSRQYAVGATTGIWRPCQGSFPSSPQSSQYLFPFSTLFGEVQLATYSRYSH